MRISIFCLFYPFPLFAGPSPPTMKIQVAALILLVLSVVDVSALPVHETKELDGIHPSGQRMASPPPLFVAAPPHPPYVAGPPSLSADRHLPRIKRSMPPRVEVADFGAGRHRGRI